MPIYAVTADLFFRAKIEEAARAIGVAAPRFASSASALRVEGEAPLVLLELGPRTGGVEAVAAILGAAPGARVVAFGSHVDTATLARARELGAAEVMARSEFTKELGRILKGTT